MSWWFSIKVELGNKLKPSKEATFEVSLEGNADGQYDQNLVVAKVIKAAKANEHYTGKKVMLKFRGKKEVRSKTKRFLIKGILPDLISSSSIIFGRFLFIAMSFFEAL